MQDEAVAGTQWPHIIGLMLVEKLCNKTQWGNT